MATQATEGVTGIVEGVHQSVWSSLGFPGGAEPGRTRGISGLVYRAVRGINGLVGMSVDRVLSKLQFLFEPIEDDPPGTPQRESVFGALNGVMGDHLLAMNSPFSIPMSLRYRGRSLVQGNAPGHGEVGGKILVLIHGLCMTDHHWRVQRGDRVVDYGESLAAASGYSPVHLWYNSGLHVSHNGRDLASKLEWLVSAWPAAVEELTVVAHSMGGLVIRSAFHLAEKSGMGWPKHVRNIVFLGTPHHGAPLERAGSWVDQVLGATPFTAPFARLGHLRSAGITDLRYGNLLDEDGQGSVRFQRAPDARRIVPLPGGVACFTVAATTAASRGVLSDRLVGDGLVPVASALGEHRDPERSLRFPPRSRKVLFRTSHLGLLGSPEVARQLVRWLG